MMSSFSRFESFGAISDEATREKLTKSIYSLLQKQSNRGVGLDNADTDNFASAIDQILSNPTMRELCAKDPELAEKITQDILDFINKTKKQLTKTDNPFEYEVDLLKESSQIEKSGFIKYFEKASQFIRNNYEKNAFDINFYTEQFKSCFFEEEWNTHLQKHEHKAEDELSLIEKFENVNAKEKEFFPTWKETLNFLAKQYKRRDIDCNDYYLRFREAFNQQKEAKNESFASVKASFLADWRRLQQERVVKEERANKAIEEKVNASRKKIIKTQNDRFTALIEHFNENWEILLKEKQTKWELEIIEVERRKFCEELYKRIDELKYLQKALEPFINELGRLWDMSKGDWQRVNLDVLKKYADLLQKDKSLMELADMLGKMRQAERELEEELFANIQLTPEWKVEYASKADLIGIHESNDLSSLLPSETALLADEISQSVFFKKFAEKKLQTFEYQARMLSFREEEFQDKRQKEKEETKGPFIICVDTSGSMHGTPETVAKTLCFAILKIAIRENRKCYLISFSTSIETINLTDIKNSLDNIITFLSMGFHGGTDATPAMEEALRMLKTDNYKKADVIMVSDFVMSSLDKNTQVLLKSAKDNNTKFHSLVIGDSKNPAIMKDFDNNWFYDIYNHNSILTLVKNIQEI